MPIYEFECTECGHVFEKMQGMSEPNPPCPSAEMREHGAVRFCKGETKKLITHSSFVLKGDGWASDGYGGK